MELAEIANFATGQISWEKQLIGYHQHHTPSGDAIRETFTCPEPGLAEVPVIQEVPEVATGGIHGP